MAGSDAEPLDAVLAKVVREEPQEAVPEDEVSEEPPLDGRPRAAHIEQNRDQRKVLERFVERDWMAKVLDLGELHAPRKIRGAFRLSGPSRSAGRAR